jgi:Cu(I)/Ag(I) efflux system membrane fusion protein
MTEAPAPAPAPARAPVAVPRPWYRDPRAWVAAVAVAGLLAVALVLTRGERAPTAGAPAAGAPVAAAGGLAARDLDGDGFVYQDAMHPTYVTDEPGIAPDCGMELTRVSAGGPSEPGTVEIDPVTLQNLGVQTSPVEVGVLERELRATGTFEVQDRRREAVSLRIGGWVEELFVNTEGQQVRRGQPLLRIYSPDLVATQEEYLLAVRNREILGGEGGSERLIEASRRRLELFGVSDGQIRELARTGRVQTALTLYAPASGTVTEKTVVEGMQVEPGQTLMEIVDLSALYLQTAVPEQDLGWVRPGVRASVEVPSLPDAVLTGRVEYVYGLIDAGTRTGTARVAVPNPGGALRPGMYATVTLFGSPSASHPLVPSDAVLRTGDEAVVVVALGRGRFRPQTVRLGEEASGRIQVLEGLRGDERVVTRAQFLIDSEARLQSALGALGGADSTGSGGGAMPAMPGMDM